MKVSGRTQRGKIEAYLCVSQESSNCGYPMQYVQTGLTKKRKKKKKERKRTKVFYLNVGSSSLLAYLSFRILGTLLFLLAENILPA